MKILSDDKTLMLFGFRFLLQVLFGEMTIAMREESVEARRGRLAEKQRRLEKEAAERVARDENEMYGDQE
ncbi:MAG: hypothetical protein AAB319_01890 [Pseudomonadota bacterium]